MRGRRTAVVLGLCVLCGGCGPLADVARVMILEPVEYPRRLEACVDKKRQEELAECAWKTYLEAHPDGDFSEDYGQGFRDGFADYLFAGGTGNPPPLPPRWYWRAENKTQEGRLGEQDWFHGFRTGATAAKLSGYREIETVGTSTSLNRAPCCTDGGPAGPPKASPLPPPKLENAPHEPGAELAPPPRPVPPPPPMPPEETKRPAP